MSQEIIELTEETTQQGVSRRSFIKGAIAASAAVSSSNYLFRSNGGALLAQSPAAGAVERLITLGTRRLPRQPGVVQETGPPGRTRDQSVHGSARHRRRTGVAGNSFTRSVHVALSDLRAKKPNRFDRGAGSGNSLDGTGGGARR